MPSRFLIADDLENVLDGYRSLLNLSYPGCTVDSAKGGREAVDAARRLQPEFVLMDLWMKEGDGIAATKAIKEILPDCKVIVVSMDERPTTVIAVYDTGADGFVHKDTKYTTIREAIDATRKGRRWYSAEHLTFVADRRKYHTRRLSDKELEVLKLYCDGFQAKEIGDRLKIADSTVSSHKTNIREKYADIFPRFSDPLYLNIAILEGVVNPDDLTRI
jgi:DNA-binding NarL/FixJ family response regulator